MLDNKPNCHGGSQTQLAGKLGHGTQVLVLSIGNNRMYITFCHQNKKIKIKLGQRHGCLKPTDPRYYLEADLSIYDAPLGALNHI